MNSFVDFLAILGSCAVLACLITLAVYAVGKWRGSTEDDHAGANELLTKLPELHDRGQLSEMEFRTIKTLLAEHLQEQLSGNGDKG